MSLIFLITTYFDKKYNIENHSFSFNKNSHFLKLLETEIEDKFNIYGKLKVKSDVYYKYDDLKKYYHVLCHEYQFYDDKDALFYKIVLSKSNSGEADFDKNILNVKDEFYVKFKKNYNKIKMVLFLHRVNREGFGSFNLEHINDNFTNIIYLDKTDISLKIDKNKPNAELQWTAACTA